MKLLTPKQVKQSQQEGLAEILRKEHDAAKALKAIEAKLQSAQQEFLIKKQRYDEELSEADLKLRTKVREEMSIVETLEQRRRNALAPIVKEQEELSIQRKQMREVIEEVGQRQSEIERSIQTLRELDTLVHERAYALEAERKSWDNEIKRKKLRLDALDDEIEERVNAFAEEEEKIEAKRRQLEKIEESARQAERIAKNEMRSTDIKLARLQEEQKKVTESRKMLGIVVQEMKKKGLWHKKYEKLIN